MSTGYVREARPGEGTEIARLQLSTWRTAYRQLFPAHILANLDEEWITRQWTAAIAEPPSPRHRVLVAVEQGPTEPPAGHPVSELVGFIAAGPADAASLAPEEKPLPDGVVAITDLLVEPRWGRRGHGSRLLAASVDLWRADGFDTAVAWAYDDDAATCKFLDSAGWRPDGATRALDVDDLLVPQLRLHASLAAEPA